jgi:uncharacterized protein (DUF697 family)/tellurite resistance protein
MTPDQTRALTSISMFAAFADGAKSDAEREKVRDVVEGLGSPSTTEAARRVLLKQTSVEQEAGLLDSEELRLLAWEAAVGVCEADGVTSPAERAFLDRLAAALGRRADEARAEIDQADGFVRAAEPVGAVVGVMPPPLPVMSAGVAGGALAVGGVAAGAGALASAGAGVDPRQAQADSAVLRFAIMAAAAELLPQGIATAAVIPLQTKMVHSVAGVYGYPLSGAMIKEFLATVGVGAAGQVIESYARKFLGKLAKQYLGKSAASIAGTAINWGTGPALTFATTYAIGMVARQYYAGGRTLSAIDLRTLLSGQVEKAKGLYSQYEPQVRQTAQSTSPTGLLSFLRGG